MKRSNAPTQEKFEARYIPEPMSGCWLWEGPWHQGTGYGTFAPSRKYVRGAHRASWEIYRGEIPEGMCVCHRCDNRMCVNPDHLFLGTQRENVQDAVRKGRMDWKPGTVRNFPRGERHHSSPLTEADVIEIRKSSLSGVALARKFGITPTSLSKVRRGLTWSHVGGQS